MSFLVQGPPTSPSHLCARECFFEEIRPHGKCYIVKREIVIVALNGMNCTTWPQFPGVREWEDNPLHNTPPLVHHMDCPIIRQATKPSVKGLLPLYTLSLTLFLSGVNVFLPLSHIPFTYLSYFFSPHSLPHSLMSLHSLCLSQRIILLFRGYSFIVHSISFISEISSTVSLGKYKW